MSTITLSLEYPWRAAYEIQRHFARQIHAMQIELHLMGTSRRDREAGFSPYLRADLAELRQVIHSIQGDRYDRRMFIFGIRHILGDIRKEKRTEPTTREYLLKVLRYNWKVRHSFESNRQTVKACIASLRRYGYR